MMAEATAFMVDMLAKGSVVLLACSASVLLLRRSPAAARHLVWTIGVVALLLLPAASWLMPGWRVSLPMPALLRDLGRPADAVRYAITPETEADAITQGALATQTGTARDEPASSAPLINAAGQPLAFDLSAPDEGVRAPVWINALFALWLTGLIVSLMNLGISLLRVAGLQRGTMRVSTGPCVVAVERAAARLGMRRAPAVHVGDEHMMPMVWGIFRPVLLLPSGAARWSAARLESVLLHELAHIRRRDPLTQFIAELARAVYWFHPLVWIAASRLYIEREHACDDIVLNAGTRPSEYATELLDLVRSLRTTRATSLAAIAMARPSQLKSRLSAVLDDARSRQSLSPRFVAAVCTVALLLVLPLAAVQPSSEASAESGIPLLGELGRAAWEVNDPPPSRPARPQGAARPAAASNQPKTNAPAPVAALRVNSGAVASQDGCWAAHRRNTSISHNSDSDDEIETMKWSSGRCSGLVRIEGKIRFSDDFTSVLSLSPNGLFKIEEDDGDTDRRLVIRNTGGRLIYDYRVAGQDREFDAAGKAWLGQAMLSMVRTTGFAADQRIDQLLRSQGPAGVIAEVRLLRSDYVQKVYLNQLLERADLTPALVRQAVETASREIESDYELATVLIAFAKRYDLNDETRAIFINATNTIQSDYEQRRVLGTALSKVQLKSADVSALLKSAQNISSDHERAQLLVGMTQKYKLEPAMRLDYLAAARGIRSDYEKRRVYQNLIKQGSLSSGELVDVLEYAGGMTSDYEKAQLLIELNQNDLSNPALQRAYLDAASEISSDYEHRRVLSSLLAKERLSPANLDLILKSAVGISSDYELAQVLLLVLKNHTISGAQKDTFMKALNTIDSSHEYGRVASALLKQSN